MLFEGEQGRPEISVKFYKCSFIVYKVVIALVMVHADGHQCLAQPPLFFSLLPICKLVRIKPNVFGSASPRQNTAGLEGLCRRAGVMSASSNCWATRILSSKFPHRLKEPLMYSESPFSDDLCRLKSSTDSVLLSLLLQLIPTHFLISRHFIQSPLTGICVSQNQTAQL